MDRKEVDRMAQQLATGFEALRDQYEKLYSQHELLEKKLVNAREQYNELAKLYNSGANSTPPLSLSGQSKLEAPATVDAATALQNSTDQVSKAAASKVRLAGKVASQFRQGLPSFSDTASNGVRIWSGPFADRPEPCSSNMPSISESPLEQDFTVEGKPSQLGCPFAGMNRKRLSSHAASVLSRYNTGSTGAASTPISSSSQVNIKDNVSRRSSRRQSFPDPIKAEICGLSDHRAPCEAVEMPDRNPPAVEDAGDAPVCPIRFLDQHSPEEVATYFEKHKHELPRSHEVCVMRYQSNEDQIKELDAKYGNIVSMIQGLGLKHKDMLPPEPEDQGEEAVEDDISDEKVRKWASSVSAQAAVECPIDDDIAEADNPDESEDRVSHFERPLRDIRVGESPSRPWGISVPAQYLEKANSEHSSKPAQISSPAVVEHASQPSPVDPSSEKSPLRCPFGHGSGPKPPGHDTTPVILPPQSDKHDTIPRQVRTEDRPGAKPADISTPPAEGPPRMVFNGPVFIGYSPEDAAKILRLSGFGGGS